MDLNQIIPSEKELSNEINKSKLEKSKTNKKIFITILVVVVIIIFGIGLFILFDKINLDDTSGNDSLDENKNNKDNNLIDENNSKDYLMCDNEACFFQAAENCTPSNYFINTTINNLFMNIVKLDSNYTILGLNEEDKCILEINYLNADSFFELDQIYEYIENEDNFKSIYIQYKLHQFITGQISSFENAAAINELNSITFEEKQEIIQESKNIAKNNYDLMESEYESEMLELKYNTEQAYLNIIETCTFENKDVILNFIDNKIRNAIFPNNTSFTYDDTSTTINTYDQVECIIINK